jgi:IS1 family transposase
MERLSKHVLAETNSCNTRRAVFSAWSLQRGYKKRQRRSFKAVEFRAARVPGYEFRSRGRGLREALERAVE